MMVWLPNRLKSLALGMTTSYAALDVPVTAYGRWGTGPFFGQTAHSVDRRLAENMDPK